MGERLDRQFPDPPIGHPLDAVVCSEKSASGDESAAAATAVVFVHGFPVEATLWSGVADLFAAQGIRSYAPDWPLGSHRTPVPTAD
ncbi:hypothetical protein [Spirillospora sp. NPDC048819]|uniref:hypothetical protein n=1 Tax=Spirillospora sp. NPDC048819 TaxID=3155268 RepID=UPI0033EF9751